jgi:[protein-PII] uridylyltransferase
MITWTKEQFRLKKAEILVTVSSAALTGSRALSIKRSLHQLSHLTDEVLRDLWQAAQFPAHSALVAVGGYGRGELFPYSDIDVLLLLPDDVVPDCDEALKTQIENFIGSCWDTGLEIGSSVRSVQECVAEAKPACSNRA